jgi:type II secretory pathway pseudopilin PulG
MSPVRTLLARLRREQSGFTLIETLVSAVMVVLVSVGVLKTLDAAAHRSGEQKSQSVAAGLAQQDQERLRAFRAQELNNYSETRCLGRKAGGGLVADPECDDPGLYKIISRGDWVSDQSGTRSCGTGARADYLRISSTVVWIEPDDAETGPRRVSLASIVAPRVGSFGDEGSLSIEVLDRNGVGRSGVGVSVTGPKAVSGLTDKNGCLFFGYLPQGNYTVNVSQAGYVDANGNNVVSRPFGVQDGSVTSAVIEYDQAGTINVTFDTKKGTAATQVAQAENVSIGHSGLAAPGWRAYGNVPLPQGTTLQASFALGSLFPFPAPNNYAVYSGNCPGANPANYGQAAQTAAPPPAGSAAVVVREVALRVRRGTSDLPTTTPKVTLTWAANLPDARGGGPTYCGGTTNYFISATSWVRRALSALPAGTPSPGDPGVPYGTYNICAEWRPTGTSPWQKLVLNGVEVSGVSGTTVALPTTGPTGTCP